MSDGGGLVVGGGVADPLVLDGAGLAEDEPGASGVVVFGVVELLEADGALEVAAALAPVLVVAPLEATAVPDHQSFFARCEGEAFM